MLIYKRYSIWVSQIILRYVFERQKKASAFPGRGFPIYNLKDKR